MCCYLLFNFYYPYDPRYPVEVFCVTMKLHNFGHLSSSFKTDSSTQNREIKKTRTI